MSPKSGSNDFSRYFNLKQKVYLVNMSAERNSEIYESLTGVVTLCTMDKLTLLISQDGHTHDEEVGTTTYKLTSESMGSGIQIMANLTGISGGKFFQLHMYGSLEMFQNRIIPRVELSAQIFNLRGNFPLATYKKRWKQVMDQLRNNLALPGLVLQEANINLSAGGIGLTVDPSNRPTPLSMFFISVDAGMPVCALAETVWEQRINGEQRCGFRFIQILKADQERINKYISNIVRQSGGTHPDFKRNWVLVDKMQSDTIKPA